MGDIVKIVRQIQDDILNPQTRLESILLKAKVLAYYLGNDGFKEWVKNELDGYGDNSLPDYRINDAIIIGTFLNRCMYQVKTITINDIDPSLRDSTSKLHISHGVTGLEEMAKQEKLCMPLESEWIHLYNIFNAEFLRQGHYQLIDAHRPMIGAEISQILGTIKSRLQDFILEISSSWDMDMDVYSIPVKRIDCIFQVTINNNVKALSMSDSDRKDGDIYNVQQAGAVGKYARSDNNVFIQSHQKQILNEAVLEIQKLLEYFEQINHSATQSEMISYVNDETTPSLKRRASAALRACGESVIDEFVLENKYLKVIKATVKGWSQPDA
jgi:AbiTii